MQNTRPMQLSGDDRYTSGDISSKAKSLKHICIFKFKNKGEHFI